MFNATAAGTMGQNVDAYIFLYYPPPVDKLLHLILLEILCDKSSSSSTRYLRRRESVSATATADYDIIYYILREYCIMQRRFSRTYFTLATDKIYAGDGRRETSEIQRPL